MTGSKLHLIIDGNFIFHKGLSVYYSPDEQNGKPKLTTEEDQAFYARKVIIDLCSAIRHFHSINMNSIIMTIDSRSWRKDIEIEENKGYKSNRVQKSTINWDGFYEVMKEVTQILTNNGFFISRIKGAEGDDLMYLYSNEFIKRGEDTIIMTGDKDMWQTVTNEDKNFVSVYTNNGKYLKIITTAELEKYMNQKNGHMDDMILEAGGMDNVKNLSSMISSKVELVTVDPLRHAFNKIFPGDGGDGVPGIFQWKTETKNGKTRTNTLTEKRVDKIWEYMNSKYNGKDLIFKLSNEVDFIYEVINTVSKGLLKKEGITKDKLKERIERNIKLMYLDTAVIPDHIQLKFKDEFEKTINKSEHAINRFNLNNFYIDYLIQDTKYDGKGDKRKVDYFKDDVEFDENDFFFDENDKLSL